MDCAVHPGVPAIDTCIKCQRAICAGCRQIVAGHAMCDFCVKAAQQQFQPPAAAPGFSAGPAPSAGGADRSIGGNWAASPSNLGSDPSLGKRVLRAFGWGPLYGQWWTLWTLIWGVIWGGLKESVAGFIIFIVLYGFVSAFVGGFVGLAIALINPEDEDKVGAIAGVVGGLAIFGLEMLLSRDAGALVNVAFYFFAGRFVGVGLARQIMKAA
jgi:hypothetical protein